MEEKSELAGALGPYCEEVVYAKGETLRIRGQHYRDMLLILSGKALVEIEQGSANDQPIELTSFDPVGEICFLQGSAATATVRAKTDLSVLNVNDAVLDKLSSNDPKLLARFLQNIAKTADERVSYNQSIPQIKQSGGKTGDIHVQLCRTREQWLDAQQLRYQVYCRELQRKSPHANHELQILSDDLDQTGHCFIARRDKQAIGTLRVNYAKEGPLQGLEAIYGMNQSTHFPDHCGICSKFIIDKTNRGGPIAMMLIAQAVQLGVRDGMHECFIDCIPKLLPYYRALGFKPSAPKFFHPENGPSIPMRLDLRRHGGRLTGEIGLGYMLRLFFQTVLHKLEVKP